MVQIKNFKEVKKDIWVHDEDCKKDLSSEKADACFKIENVHFKNDFHLHDKKKNYAISKCWFDGGVFLPDPCKNIIIENCAFWQTLETPFNIENSIVWEIAIVDKEFGEDYVVKGSKVFSMHIENTVFNAKVRFEGCNLASVTLKNVTFNDRVDFVSCVFGEEKSGDWVRFEDVGFGSYVDFSGSTFNSFASFEKSHFEKKAKFLNAGFKNGLSLFGVTYKTTLNFFGAQGLLLSRSKKKTNRETYRIIKLNFIKLRNRIDAMSYAAAELDKHLHELCDRCTIGRKYVIAKLIDPKCWWNVPEQLILILQKYTSNYGQSWILPLFWMVVVGMAFSIFELQKHESYIEFSKNLFMFKENEWNAVLKNMSIYPLGSSKKSEATNLAVGLILAHKVLLGYLYYQFIISVRKFTKKI